MDVIFAIRKKPFTTKVIRLLFKWEAELPVSRLISSFGLDLSLNEQFDFLSNFLHCS